MDSAGDFRPPDSIPTSAPPKQKSWIRPWWHWQTNRRDGITSATALNVNYSHSVSAPCIYTHVTQRRKRQLILRKTADDLTATDDQTNPRIVITKRGFSLFASRCQVVCYFSQNNNMFSPVVCAVPTARTYHTDRAQSRAAVYWFLASVT